MKRGILVLSIVLFTGYAAEAQSIGEWQSFLDEYCENYFESCFGWSYIKIVSIDDIDQITNDKVVIEGKVRNTGYFGQVFNRDFKATIEMSGDDVLRVNFAKQGYTALRGYFWTDCRRNL